jgi:hypothetical protein
MPLRGTRNDENWYYGGSWLGALVTAQPPLAVVPPLLRWGGCSLYE